MALRIRKDRLTIEKACISKPENGDIFIDDELQRHLLSQKVLYPTDRNTHYERWHFKHRNNDHRPWEEKLSKRALRTKQWKDNDGFSDFYGKHKNKPVFLVGCGPGMGDKIAKRLIQADAITLGSGQVYRAIEPHDFTTTYYFATDCPFDRSILKIIRELEEKGTTVFIRRSSELVYRQPSFRVFGLNDSDTFEHKYSKKQECVRFSVGFNSLSVLLQVAVMMGGNPIYLVGFDFRLSPDGWIHFWWDEIDSREQNRRKDEFENVKGFLKRNALPILEKKGIKVFNLTPGSKLDIFPYKDFDAAIRGKVKNNRRRTKQKHSRGVSKLRTRN